MKARILLLCLVLSYLSESVIFSQDLIVTKAGDSLNCNITSIDDKDIYFSFISNNEMRIGKRPIADVIKLTYDFYPVPKKPRPVKITSYQHFRLTVQGGLSYRTADLAEDIPSLYAPYMNDLKSGFNYGIDATGFFSKSWGVGIKYNSHLSKNLEDNVNVFLADGSFVVGRMSDDIRISFIGPSLTMRTYISNYTGYLYAEVSVGHIRYRDEGTLINLIDITGHTTGLICDLGFDFIVLENFAFGCQCSYMTGKLDKLTMTNGAYTNTEDLDKENRENLSHLDISLGCTINL